VNSSWHNENDHFTPWVLDLGLIAAATATLLRAAMPDRTSGPQLDDAFVPVGAPRGTALRAEVIRRGATPVLVWPMDRKTGLGRDGARFTQGASSACPERIGSAEGKSRGVHGNLPARSMHCVRMGGADLPVALPMARGRIRSCKRPAGRSLASPVAVANAAGASVGRRGDSSRTFLGATGGSCEPDHVGSAAAQIDPLGSDCPYSVWRPISHDRRA
jgi:hypothetical protein